MTRMRPTALTVFLCVLLVVLGAYTWLAWNMDWRAAAGRLGPGFFPRVIGVAGIVLCGAAAVRSLRRTERRTGPAPDKPDDAADERHPWPLAAVCAGLVAFLVLLVPLGAVLAPALFMFGLSWLLARDHPTRNRVRDAALSVAVPVVLYALFEIVLDAGLPEGLLIPLP